MRNPYIKTMNSNSFSDTFAFTQPGDDDLKPAHQTTANDKYALPLCLRKLYNRNQDILTKEDRLKIKAAFVNSKGEWQLSGRTIVPEPPRFLPTQCLTRFVWRVVSLDNLIYNKMRYLFTLLGAVVVTITTTLMFNMTAIEAQQLQYTNGTKPNTADAWGNWLATFWLLLLAVLVISVLEFIYFTYKKWFLSTQELLKQERFEFAMAKYTAHNPYGPDYTNEYNSANDQDPDAVIMWLMDNEEEFERKAENQEWNPRMYRAFRRFTLLDYVDQNPKNIGRVNKCLYLSCCCFSYRGRKVTA